MALPVLDYISDQEEPKQQVMQWLHDLICSFPEIEPRLTLGIPFYYRKKWICYLNPTRDGQVELGFPKGHLLSNEQGLLQANGRSQVRGIKFGSVAEIPVAELQEILAEAIIIDEELTGKTNKRRAR